MTCVLEVAIEAARKAGKILMDGMSRPLDVERRVAHDVKLSMDRKAEEAIVSVIRKAFPAHSILSEECGRIGQGGEYEWVIDPLDGTYNYFRRIPFWTTSIAVRCRGEELVGVVFDPCRDELFIAEKGSGARLGDQKLQVSGVAQLSRAVIGVAYSPKEEFMRMNAETALSLATTVDKIRSLGSAALEIAYVACGRLDAFFEYGIWPWDVAAGVLLVREAQGSVTVAARAGGRLDVLTSNGLLHDGLARLTGIRPRAAEGPRAGS